jgi:hypothetical protein
MKEPAAALFVAKEVAPILVYFVSEEEPAGVALSFVWEMMEWFPVLGRKRSEWCALLSRH